MLRFVGNVLGGIFTALTLGMVFAALTVGGIFYMYSRDLPSHQNLAQYTPATISRIYSGEGRIIDEFAQERRLFVASDVGGHKELIRDENDLIYNLLLSFPTAALGGTVEIPTIDGKVKVKIESGTQPGKVLRLRGKGLPSVNGYGTGDLLVNISVYVPETLSKDEKKTLEEMKKSDNFAPNPSIEEKIFRRFKSYFE